MAICMTKYVRQGGGNTLTYIKESAAGEAAL